MMTWKQIKDTIEKEGVQDDDFIKRINIYPGEILLTEIDEHNIVEVSSM